MRTEFGSQLLKFGLSIKVRTLYPMLNNILKAFHPVVEQYKIVPFGDGLINHTWKVTDLEGKPQFILQRINKQVFLSPNDIADNIKQLNKYLSKTNPAYPFISPLPTTDGKYILHYTDDEYYRLFPFVENSVTISTVENPAQAFEAATQFARFTRLLSDFNTEQLNYTLPGFHNLSTRFKQFQQAVQSAGKERLLHANAWVDKAYHFRDIASTHVDIVKNKRIPLRVIHHDTKISNVLFDQHNRGLCVIDLDTVMPGYFISDVGDMMRTYLSPANEEEKDLDKIAVRESFFEAIVKGYFAEMGDILTKAEKSLFVYAGKFMIYMQAIRFLADYLNNDIYYPTHYPGHNLMRAKNQFTLLERYCAFEEQFEQLVVQYTKQKQPVK